MKDILCELRPKVDPHRSCNTFWYPRKEIFMATTFQSAAPEYQSNSDKKSIAWGISLAVVLALVIIFAMRSISNERAVSSSATGAGSAF